MFRVCIKVTACVQMHGFPDSCLLYVLSKYLLQNPELVIEAVYPTCPRILSLPPKYWDYGAGGGWVGVHHTYLAF